MHSPHTILFICTGNYYRSRYAEAVFNHLCQTQGIDAQAFSRGLAIHLVEGDISPHTEKVMGEQGLDLSLTGPTRVSVTQPDLERADRIIALKEAEHRFMMREQFPDWEDRVEYWTVHDLDADVPENALPQIQQKVRSLVEKMT